MTTKILTASILVLMLFACNQNETNKSTKDSAVSSSQKGSVANEPDTTVVAQPTADSSLLLLSDSILRLFKNQDFAHLGSYIHPQSGIRLSPYGVTDTLKDQRLTAKQLSTLTSSKKTVNWGISEGSGEPISLNVREYFKRFVYDVDFINAERKSINNIIGPDSSSSNITSVYPGHKFVQFYFSGFNKQYEGMDWKSLVLVFKKENGRRYLVAVLHDQWKG
ncbi:hypothetical protein [Segetibacter aerophilus]|uniref:Lipoprotein n=1 Tax=Segetibacter aerophilus TaxID=670293 RepID=A0A512BGX5_9BACT|nr:hypothetical protein [Segetibacter aerophilus]GEO11067.1 hypothetical protein SAE01_35630 [Segetibacter aerophilus]